jgi:hypothetical protein
MTYFREYLEVAQEAKTGSFDRRRRDNNRAFRNCGRVIFGARDDDLAKIKSDKEAFVEEEHLRRSQFCRDYQALVYRPWTEKKRLLKRLLKRLKLEQSKSSTTC